MQVQKRKTICEICGKEISNSNFKRHHEHCQHIHSEAYVDKKQHIMHEGLNCIYCDKECKNKNSLAQHEVRCAKNPNRKNYNSLIAYGGILKGQTKETSDTLKKISDTLKEGYKQHKYIVRHWPQISYEQDYVYYEHNKEEIQKWLNFINDSNIIIPKYTISNIVEGYNVILRKSDEVKQYGNSKIYFEQDFLINVLFDGTLQQENTVHHRNKNRQDNRYENLMVFVNSKAHKQYHTSKYAYLTYNEQTHLFECAIKK